MKSSGIEPILKPVSGDPLGATVHRLDNGLTVYLSPNDQEPRVYYEIAVRAGSRHDPPEATGMAHYLEHMQFKGTERLGTLDFQREKPHLDRIEALYERLFQTEDANLRREIYAEIDKESRAASREAVPNELGRIFSEAGFNRVNAHTSQDQTVYEGSFPANRAELWARLESDRLSDPVYRLFLPELEIVYEEYNRYLDNADAAFYNAGAGALFKGHPYGRDIIGLGAHLKNPSISRMRRFFHDYYRPNNMVVILSGDFERAEMLRLIKRFFGGLKPAPLPPAPPGTLQRPQGQEKSDIRCQAEEKAAVGWLIPGHRHPDEHALILMDMLMDNQWTGILNLSVNKAQKVKKSGSFPIFLNEGGGWFLWASSKAGQSLEQAEEILLDAVGKLKAGEFKDDDLKAVITDFEVMEKKRLEKNQYRVEFMRSSFIESRPWPEAIGRVERLKQVTKAEVLAAANRYLGENRVVIYRRTGHPDREKVAKPEFSSLAIEPGRQSKEFLRLSRLPAKPLAPRFLRRGREYRVLNRSWGRIYWTGNAVNDLFHLELRFPAGTSQDRRLKPAFHLLDLCGAGPLSVEEFQRRLYRLGSKMSASAGERESFVRLSGLQKNLEETLRLALSRFSAPMIAREAFIRMVEVERGDRRTRKLDPQQIFSALSEFAERGPGSQVMQELSPSELDALTESDLRQALAALPGLRLEALYTGSLLPEKAAEAISRAWDGLRRRPAPKIRPLRFIAARKDRVIFVHRDQQTQALIGGYAADGSYRAGERLDYALFNTIMGGMSGLYFQEVREARALAYTAAGGYQPGDRKGDDNRLWCFAGTQADKAAETGALLRELMARPGLTAERFLSARREREEAYRAESLSLEEIPFHISRWERLGLKADPRRESFRELKNYKLGRIKRFAASFARKPMTFWILADRSRVDLNALKSWGKFEERGIDELFPF